MKCLKMVLLFALLAILAAFSGCGGADSRTGSSAEPAERQLKVLLWYQDEGRKQSFQNYISQYEEAFPDVKIEFELIVDTVELQIKTQAYSASGELPDVLFTFSPAIMPLIEANQLLDLYPYVSEDGFIDKYTNDSCIQLYGGKALYALNSGGIDYYFSPAILYHQDMFTRLGLEIPQTYEEWLQVCMVLKDDGITPIVLAGKDGTVPAMVLMQLFYMAEDPQAVEDLLEGRTDWSGPAFSDAIDKVTQMVKAGYFSEDVAMKSYDEAIGDFCGEEAAMIFVGGWEITNIASKCTDVAIMEMPSLNQDVTPGEAVELWGARYGGYAVSASSEYPELAVQFAEFCVEADARTYGINMQMPVAFDLGEEYAISELAAAQKQRVDNAVYRLPNIAEWLMDARTQSEYYALMNRLMTGTLSGEQFLEEFSAVWEYNTMNER